MQFLFPHLEWVIARYKKCYTLFVFIPRSERAGARVYEVFIYNLSLLFALRRFIHLAACVVRILYLSPTFKVTHNNACLCRNMAVAITETAGVLLH